MRMNQWVFLASAAMVVMSVTPALAIEMLPPAQQEAMKKCLENQKIKIVTTATPEQTDAIGKCYEAVVPLKPVTAVKPAAVAAKPAMVKPKAEKKANAEADSN